MQKIDNAYQCPYNDEKSFFFKFYFVLIGIMQLFAALKQLITLQPAIMQFVLEKVYYRKDRHIDGTFYIQPNKELTIVSIHLEVIQSLNITKDEVEKTLLGEKVFNQQISLWRLEKHELAFSFPLKFPRETKRERKTYKGDMWALNKASDKARKQLNTYTITATIKLKWKKEPLVYQEKIRVE